MVTCISRACSACQDRHGAKALLARSTCEYPFLVGRLSTESGGWLNRSSPVPTTFRLVLLVNASTPGPLGRGR
ncbi:hypothetical protein [Ktedonobacter robiniae]|uniref:hypothetical protein n=1 Tax=Ktedonobacter robiniae TaxID=2778365 RepID=UPI001915CBE8|nr:hypothetical protein [Ktedonobacter robiniae]